MSYQICLMVYIYCLVEADFPALLKKAEVLGELSVSKKQQQLVEEKTRDQENSRLWYHSIKI